MNYVYLLLGSNLGDSRLLIENTSKLIYKNIGKIINESSFYESPPWGFTHENSFLNKVLFIETNFDAQKVLDECQSIERKMGRLRTNSSEYEAREIDVDILFFNDEIIKTQDLTVPHPRIEERRFALLPMSEIAENFIHPVLKCSIFDVLNNCKDNSKVVIV